MLQYLHDIGFVYGGDTLAPTGLCIVESIARNTFRRIPGNQLDGLNDAIDDLS